MKLSIVLSTQPASFSALAYKGEMENNIAEIARLGYDGVELAVRDPALLDKNALRQLLSEHKLQVPAIGTGQAYGEEGLSFTHPDFKIREQAITRIKSQIDFAAELDAVVIIGLVRGKADGSAGHSKSYGWLVAALAECAAHAATKQTQLVLEPINRYETDLINTVDAGLKLIDDVKSDSFGLLLDTFHMNIEEPSIEASIRAAGERIFHFHVADSNRWYPGAGHLDFRRIISVLRETGYAGFVSAEILPRPDSATCARETIRNLRVDLEEVE